MLYKQIYVNVTFENVKKHSKKVSFIQLPFNTEHSLKSVISKCAAFIIAYSSYHAEKE